MKPDDKVLLANLSKIAYTLDKAYIANLSKEYIVLPFAKEYNKDTIIDYGSNIRALKINNWVYDKKEKPGDCLKNVLSLFADGDHTIALVVVRKPEIVEMYFVVKNDGKGRNEDSKNNLELLNDAIKGNFPGTKATPISPEDAEKLFSFETSKSVAVLSNTPSMYSEDYTTQGLERLLNGIVPKETKDSYAVVFLAESLTHKAIRDAISGFEEIATSIYPFAGHQMQIGENQSETRGTTKANTISTSVGQSVNKTHSVSGGAGIGIKGIGVHAAYGYSWGESNSITEANSNSIANSITASLAISQSTNYAYKSYVIQDMLDKTEETIQRLTQSQSTGLWKYATYVFSGDTYTSKNVANYLKSLTQGKKSYIEPSFIQCWLKKEGCNKKNALDSSFDEIKDYVFNFTHPVFLAASIDNKDIMKVTATAYVATDEISNVIAFTKKSLPGLPVTECVQFGREPHTLIPCKLNLELGYAYHMRETYDGTSKEKKRISISQTELSKHTFITGATGSGKSNTIYSILDSVKGNGITYLVIEPSKGEYKTALSSHKSNILGTNPQVRDSLLLRMNPFKFPDGIHVLEHIDRLVEIFNVCWPMYAAMPAILKESIERAYEAAGWDLSTSLNNYDRNLFPTFEDVLNEIQLVLNASAYSDDNKSDYIGALVTRIKSLTNGINGLIFTNDDINDKILFDENTIIDLSRVGSVETKSLIMGILILKLQEYRMSQREANGKPNENLKHITVIEEAHNLLKRTTISNSTEGSNLHGKAVEMISNAIAEMRTYGEGFIIADQAPGLLDMAVIRNTNTKIIMRLPDFSDRELVGKAAGLNDDQIIELARLEKGVAAISQSDWIEPVLCKIDLFINTEKAKADNEKKNNSSSTDSTVHIDTEVIRRSLIDCIMNSELYRKGDRVDIKKLKGAILRSGLTTVVKKDYLDYISSDSKTCVKALRILMYDLFNVEEAFRISQKHNDIYDWVHSTIVHLYPSILEYTKPQIDRTIALLIYEQSIRDTSYNDLLSKYAELLKLKGGVL